MGTTADVTVVGGPRALLDVARGRLTDLEHRWSRFIPTSEVSRLNRADGLPTRVSSETRLLVQRALEGHEVTGGRFDPTLLGAVLRAGYVESFDRIGRRPRRVASSLVTGARRIEVDEAAGTVRIPVGVGFDPGGIGKGLAADLVAEELFELGAGGACVNVGGDARGPRRAARRRGLAGVGREPVGARRAARAAPPAGRRGGDELPVAPSLGARGRRAAAPPRRSRDRDQLALAGARRDRVVASEGWKAEVLSKAAFLDAGRGLELIDQLGAAALVIVPDGSLTTSTWAALTDDRTAEALP